MWPASHGLRLRKGLFSEPYAFEESCYVESPYDITGMCDACTLNSVLGRALYSPAYHGDCFRPRFDDELDRFVFDIDTRRGVESEFAAFTRCGHEVPPCTDELKDLMLQAAQRDHEFQRCGATWVSPDRSTTGSPTG